MSNTMFPANLNRYDPYKSYRFLLYFSPSTTPVAAVSKLTPIKRSSDVIEYKEGGNAVILKGLGRMKYEPITAERGISQDKDFATWADHANPIVRSDLGAANPWELTLTTEHRSYDELSRLWQATTVPLRMSLVYRAAVVFIDPDPMPPPAPNPESVTVAADPAELPVGEDPVVFGTFRDGSYVGPTGSAVCLSLSPATAAAGQTIWLMGSDLGSAGRSDSVYLLPPDGSAEVDVTAWAVAGDSTAAKFVLTLPSTVGTAPGEAPVPGVYQLRAGSGAPGTPGATRTGSAPVSIAAYVNSAGGPVLAGLPPFTVYGAGFIPGATQVLLGTVALTDTVAAPAPGEVSIDPSGTFFSFSPPTGPTGMTAPIRVRVHGIESDPALWVAL